MGVLEHNPGGQGEPMLYKSKDRDSMQKAKNNDWQSAGPYHINSEDDKEKYM